MRKSLPKHHSQQEPAAVFWGEMAPAEHLVQVYTDEQVFLDTLEAFVWGGLQGHEAVVIIATLEHIHALEARLITRGSDLEHARATDQYLTFSAQEMLARFMVEGWPEETLFKATVAEVLRRARQGGRQVRAFGEMVALLWAQGHCGATVRLEHLWETLCQAEAFSLFCAYPKSGFTETPCASLNHICAAHSKVIAG